MTMKKLSLMTTMIKLDWQQDYSQKQIQVFRDHELASNTKENIESYYDEFISKRDRRPYKLKVTMKDVNRLYKITKALCKNIWLKNRYPEYYSRQWAALSNESILYRSDLMFLKQIQDGTRPLEQLIGIFRV